MSTEKAGGSRDFEIVIKGRSYEDVPSLVSMLDHIKGIGNIGHSFEIVVDPDNKEYRDKFGWDGDGSDYISSVKLNGKEFKAKKKKSAAFILGEKAATRSK